MNQFNNIEEQEKSIFDYSDERTRNYPFVESGWFVFTCVFLYLFTVKYGVKFMQNKKPLNLKVILIFYNFFLVLWSGYNFYLLLRYAVLTNDFNHICYPLDHRINNETEMLAWGLYLYYISKVIELLDTVFFILRKKNNQISFLHVYHHATMPILWWIGAKYVPGGESYLSPMINSLVHVTMYAYYGLSAFGPWIQPYLWWKKFITVFQISQFSIVIAKTVMTIFSGCGFGNFYLWAQLLYMVSLLFLFLDFYSQTYTPVVVPIVPVNEALESDKIK